MHGQDSLIGCEIRARSDRWRGLAAKPSGAAVAVQCFLLQALGLKLDGLDLGSECFLFVCSDERRGAFELAAHITDWNDGELPPIANGRIEILYVPGGQL